MAGVNLFRRCPYCNHNNGLSRTNCAQCSTSLVGSVSTPQSLMTPTTSAPQWSLAQNQNPNPYQNQNQNQNPYQYPTPVGGSWSPWQRVWRWVTSQDQLVRVRGTVLDVHRTKTAPVFRLAGWRIVLAIAILAMVLSAFSREIGTLFFKIIAILIFIQLFPIILKTMLSTIGGFHAPNMMSLDRMVTSFFKTGASAAGEAFSSFDRQRNQRKREITLHEVFLREPATGRQLLIRIEGDLTNGAIRNGHDIEVEGWNDRGTIIFRCGVNHSLGLGSGGLPIVVSTHRP